MRFDVKFSITNHTFNANLGEVEGSFGANFGEIFVVQGNYAPEYEGPYEIIPKVNEQTFETAQKLMVKNLQVKSIPTYEVSNNAGGQTFYITKE